MGGGGRDEDGSVIDPSAGAGQGEVGRLARAGHHGQRVYSVLAGGTFQTGSGDGAERTVSDGTSREERSWLAEQA